jgi:hypothetical protein
VPSILTRAMAAMVAPTQDALSSVCVASSRLLGKVLEPPSHTADVAAIPVQPTTKRTRVHRGAKGTDVWWERSDELVIREFKPCIAERAAAEWIECPVEGEATCELPGQASMPRI